MRKGSDLMYEVHLRLEESLLGWERQLQAHPSGKDLHIVWTGGVLRDGEILRVADWGMPDRSSGGACGVLRILCRVDTTSYAGPWSETHLQALQSVWPDWKKPVVLTESVMVSR